MTEVILVTGASSGMGYQTAQLLAQNDYKVYGAARRLEKMDPLKEYGVVPISLDLTDEESCKNCIDEVIKK